MNQEARPPYRICYELSQQQEFDSRPGAHGSPRCCALRQSDSNRARILGIAPAAAGTR